MMIPSKNAVQRLWGFFLTCDMEMLVHDGGAYYITLDGISILKAEIRRKGLNNL